MMSKYPSSSADDAVSISNQPLIPKAAEPKDYEAALGALMSSYGLSSGIPPIPARAEKKKDSEKDNKKDKGKSKRKATAGAGGSGSAPAEQPGAPPSSSTPTVK